MTIERRSQCHSVFHMLCLWSGDGVTIDSAVCCGGWKLLRIWKVTGAKLDGLTRLLAHPGWRTSEAVSKHSSVLAVAVRVGLVKWDHYFVMILGAVEQKETLKMLTNTVVRSVRKIARDGLTNILGWANFVCDPGLDRLTRLEIG